ncbi:hypothetical protein PPERSA_07436 [Pseudocohnilembus persalinus]|uniref:Transmembrane protein n=1 Tax=Pseudocohnilembus persalinus TaxID=266149 RepID=A0A0V0QAE2_PSEPJ|nr:hypothetical protein PPERSA_07436 [Pseudocohnilembus persalinus]|eukprot:KRW99193.1 hypothetical protein PPERSA_07436 [Pseudocohnilembus persalinus]
MSYSTRRYISDRENAEQRIGWNNEELQASELRKQFIARYIANFDTNLYKTQIERDWGYIAKREYRYDVTINSLVYGFIGANFITSATIFARKKMVWWTIPTFTFLGYYYWQPIFLQKHNKKLFDMCNVGEQYFLGKQRNEVLAKCNAILNREDF